MEWGQNGDKFGTNVRRITMSQKWKTLEEGIRVRYHATRKHGIRPDAYFTLRIQINGKRAEKSLGWASEGMTLSKARLELARMKEAARSGTDLAMLREQKAVTEAGTIERQVGLMTIGEFWDRHYYPEALRTKKSAGSEEKLFRNWIRPRIGDVPLRDLRKIHVDEVANSILQAGLAPRTAQYAVAVSSLLWNVAFSMDLVTGENPVRKVRKPKVDNRRLRFLSPEEATALLELTAKLSHDLHDECILALYAGLRAGEIHGLTWGDVDFDNGQILIRDPKNGQNRFAFINAPIEAMLKQRYTVQDNHRLLFPTADGKKRVQVSRAFMKCVSQLGFNDGVTDSRQRVVFHTLRHTFASWLVQKGVPLHTVAELMGHKSIAMTQRYAHLSPDSLRNAAKILGEGLTLPRG